MAIPEDREKALRKIVLPTVAGVIGTGAGLFLKRKQKPRGSTNGNTLGIGDFTDDLRRKLDSVLSKSEQSRRAGPSASQSASDFIPGEFAERRREREQRRRHRRRKT